ncbi:MAG: hypothetical protein L0Y56_08825, partial [Nitrospira sp.]|nr:hypothetical protein [Nitrospira sp.]
QCPNGCNATVDRKSDPHPASAEPDRFGDVVHGQLRTPQEGGFKVEGNQVTITLDDGRGTIQIKNEGHHVEVHVHFHERGVGLVHSSANVFKITPVTSTTLNPE